MTALARIPQYVQDSVRQALVALPEPWAEAVIDIFLANCRTQKIDGENALKTIQESLRGTAS